jgi:hypothetical protein
MIASILNRPGPSLLVLLALNLLVRLPIWTWYAPIVEGDSFAYLIPARLLQEHQYHLYEGSRTPGYPLFLLAAGLRPAVVWALQSVCGIAVSLLVFALGRRLTGHVPIALAAGAVHTLSLDALFLEPFLISETLATFLLVLACVLVQRASAAPNAAGPPAWAAGAGAITGLLILTRPVFAYLVPLTAVWLAFACDRRRGAAAIAFLLPPVLLVGGLSLYNLRHVGVFTPSTMTGFFLSQHVGGFVEETGDEDAVLRDIYLAHRARIRARYGSHGGTIWSALPEMMQRTHLTYAQLSQRWLRISLRLIATHPAAYLRSVAEAWIAFWKRPHMVWLERIRSESFATLVRAAWWVERPLGILANGLFLLIAATTVARWVRGRPGAGAMRSFLILNVVLGSLIQALFELGNGRYAIPYLPLIQLVVIATLWPWRKDLRPRVANAQSVARTDSSVGTRPPATRARASS